MTGNKTILCVEDEPGLRRDLVEELQYAGYDVVEAANGGDALMVIAHCKPDIVLCDIQMPGLSGLQVLEAVRSGDSDIADVPFILLTAYGEKRDIIKGRSLGADDYLVKPVDYDLLLATLETRLARVARVRQRVTDHANELERQLNDLLNQPVSPGEADERQELQRLLACSDVADCHLVLASIDASRRLQPQFGPMIAGHVLDSYRRMLGALLPDRLSRTFRLGSDVFGLLIEGRRAWSTVSGRIEALTDTSLNVLGKTVPITSTLAVVQRKSGDSQANESMVDDALLALRSAQRDGGRTLVRVDDPVRDRLRIMQFIEGHVADAIPRGEFSLAFQPKVRISGGAVVGAEALIRWNSRERGLISPALFIPIVEKLGLAQMISEWVLDSAARTIRDLGAHGLSTKIAVNASGMELHAQFADRVQAVLHRYGIPDEALEVEITETSVVQDMAFAADVTGRLRKRGSRVMIDDFGTGYSSLAYLRSFPLDGVKIDQSFVRGLASSPIDRQIVESVIRLSHALGLETVAEGVETAAQFTLLEELGCDCAQGYLISKPLPLHAFKSFLASQRLSHSVPNGAAADASAFIGAHI